MKNRNILESFNNAANGIMYAIKNERNMKFHIGAAIVVIILSLIYGLKPIEFIIVCITIGAIIICELFNTAIEAIVDILVYDYHPKAKIAKDTAAGAVLVAAFVSLIVAYFIFFDKISLSFNQGLNRIKHTPMTITIISLVVTVLLVVTIKAFFRKGTPFQGGMPSGHTAVAFSISTAVALWTNNTKISILFVIISLLLVQSRFEAKIHNFFELAAGAILGFLTTVLIFQLIL